MIDRPDHGLRRWNGTQQHGDSPWVAFKAIAEDLDYGRYTTRTNQVLVCLTGDAGLHHDRERVAKLPVCEGVGGVTRAAYAARPTMSWRRRLRLTALEDALE
jgi:hypothetical protein